MSPSLPQALADLEKKKIWVVFCFLVLKVQLRVKAYKRNPYFPKGFNAIASVNQKNAFSINQTIQFKSKRLFMMIRPFL